jgi:hypothetical protein
MATKVKTQGILLQKQISSTYTTIAQRLKLDGPTSEMLNQITTDLDNTMEERKPTIVDPGEISGTLWYDPNTATHQVFTTDQLAGTQASWKLVFPDGMTTPAHFIVTGFITKFRPTGMETKGYLQAEFTLQCDGGTYSFTPGA